MQAYLLDLQPDVGNILDKLTLQCPAEGIRHLFYAAHGVDGNTMVPPCAHEKDFFNQMLRKRYVQMGSMLKDITTWKEKYPDNGWTSIPIWTGKVTDDKITELIHITGLKAVATDPVSVGGAWHNSWSDTEAFYKSKSGSSIFVKDLFDFTDTDPKTALPAICEALRPGCTSTATETPATTSTTLPVATTPTSTANMAPARTKRVKRAKAPAADEPESTTKKTKFVVVDETATA